MGELGDRPVAGIVGELIAIDLAGIDLQRDGISAQDALATGVDQGRSDRVRELDIFGHAATVNTRLLTVK